MKPESATSPTLDNYPPLWIEGNARSDQAFFDALLETLGHFHGLLPTENLIGGGIHTLAIPRRWFSTQTEMSGHVAPLVALILERTTTELLNKDLLHFLLDSPLPNDWDKTARTFEFFLEPRLPQSDASTSIDIRTPESVTLAPVLDTLGAVTEAREGREVSWKLGALFTEAEQLPLENGMESPFSRGLVTLLLKYRKLAVSAVGRLVNDSRVSDEVSWEALRWMGRIEDPVTYYDRLQLLEQSLDCPRIRLRDAAALGLASMNDPRAIGSLQRAVERETYAELRDDMSKVLAQLQEA